MINPLTRLFRSHLYNSHYAKQLVKGKEMKTLKKQIADAAAICPMGCVNTHNESSVVNESLAQTPTSNTGLNSQTGFTVGLDWLDITFRKVPDINDVWQIVSDVELLLDDEIDFSATRATFNGRNWDGSGRGLKGVQLFYDAGYDGDEFPQRSPALKIAMSGRVVQEADQHLLALWLHGRTWINQVECTRIDIALDDHEKFVDLRKITQAKRTGNFFNTSWSAYMESGKRGEDIGVTVYFGSPQSDKRLRVYDKTVESNSVVVGNRWEAEFRRKAATEALNQWIEASVNDKKDVAQWCKDTVLGVVDFRNRSSGDPNRFRCPVLGWFKRFCKRLSASPIRVRVAAPTITVQKSIDWVIKSVAPTLSIIRDVLKGDYNKFISEAMTEGNCRLPLTKRRLITTTSKQQLVY